MYIFLIENNRSGKCELIGTGLFPSKCWDIIVRDSKKETSDPFLLSIRKYGEGGFSVRLLEEVSQELFHHKMAYWRKRYPLNDYTEDSVSFIGKRKGIKTVRKGKPNWCKTYVVTDPDGNKEYIYNLKRFCKEKGLHVGNMCWVAKGRLNHYKGWKCTLIIPQETKI